MPDNAHNSPPLNWLNEPLAIVGMACRLPGADGLDAFWKLLHDGGYPIERMPVSKLDRQRYFDPKKGRRGKTYADVGGFVSERELDWSLLNLTPQDAQQWDECHLNFCEVAARACKHAGYDPRNLANRNVGVFVGHSGGSTLGGELAYRTLVEDYLKLLDEIPDWQAIGNTATKQRLQQSLAAHRPLRVDGRPWVEAGFAAGLVCHALGLNGPHMAIDAACASSLVALAMGAMSIHSGQTDMAIVGGASFNKTDSLILFSQAQSCSSSESRPFDERADGLISSEGYVALVIKSLSRAQADGDAIQAVLHGIGISTDGRGKSLWAPRKEGQYAAIARAYSAEVRPESVQLIEAHATSTHLGDATEMEALAAFYGRHLPPGSRLPVGSVKSNIGHTLETAGLAGIVKVVLSMQHGIIPPSINVSELNQSIPWQDIPLSVVREPGSWPSLPSGCPRRAAVNAFGIGGLNVHVVVEQACERRNEEAKQLSTKQARPHSREQLTGFEPIAIIGRGLVLPGAIDVQAYQNWLVKTSVNPVGSAADRVKPGMSRDVATIDGFHYDWRKHKVPPKQIAQANPLQFMLLEAAEQALREAGLLQREFDRQHTAVVVGSVFGGDFGNALFAGLRLPEFRDRLLQALTEQGCSAERASRLADDYEVRFLENYPALIDETGSFTSSTLASRLSKTYDLMGGAMAIDAGDVSSFAALNAACQLLHSGTVNLVLCAAGQLATDRAALENLAQCGRLHRRGPAGEGYAVGQGVALILLKPLSAAHRDGDQVLGIIDGLGVGFEAESLTDSIRMATSQVRSIKWPNSPGSRHEYKDVVGSVGLPEMDCQISQGTGARLQPSQNLPLTGFLHGVQGLVDLIGVTLSPSTGPKLIASHTQSGQSYVVSASAGAVLTPAPPPPAKSTLTTVHNALTTNIYRLSARSLDELKLRLNRLSTSPADFHLFCQEFWSDRNTWRAAIVCEPHDLATQAHKCSLLVGNAPSRASAMDQGLLWSAPLPEESSPTRVAWLFPGQGSQYVGMLAELCRNDEAAAGALVEANTALAKLAQPSFEQLAWNSDNQLGENVWHTQAAMLIADWIMFRTLRSRGLTADIVSGHSYGEFAAMLAAGCWNLPTALQATYDRCRSITENVPPGCAMLSIQADAQIVADTIASSGLPLSISHRNAPQQTVVGGKQAHIAQLAQRLDDEGFTSRLLPVPSAFHTDALIAARRPFRTALESIELHPPLTALLSSVDNRFIADPDSIRDGLAQQLTAPLDFVALVERLVRDGVTLAFEVGPQQVLSRLVRQSTDRFPIVATDHAKFGAVYQMQIVTAMCDLYGLTHRSIPLLANSSINTSLDVASTNLEFSKSVPSQLHARSSAKKSAVVLHFDATAVRRSRARSSGHPLASNTQSHIAGKSLAIAPQHFDATQVRRHDRRQEAQSAAFNILPQGNERADVTHDCLPNAEAVPDELPTNIETFLIDFVVEQTGYPAEIIELDWDIEADLGIDSIKKAQLFGELREFFDLESLIGFKLDDYRTLRHIAELLHRTPGKSDWLNQECRESSAIEIVPSTSSTPPTTSPSIETTPSSRRSTDQSSTLSASATTGLTSSNHPSSLGHHTVAELSAFLVDFVVEQTGYPPEIVELDADLEADLGIDSIKKAQLFGEIREMFAIDPASLATKRAAGEEQTSRSGLDDIRTLRQILDALVVQQATLESGTAADADSSRSQLTDHSAPANKPAFAATLIPAAGDAASQPPASSLTPQIPLWYSANRTPDSSLPYTLGLEANLRALVARRDASPLASLPNNGKWNEYQDRIEQLAHLANADPSSMQALERALVGQLKWRSTSNFFYSHASHHEVLWLFDWQTPAWLSASGLALALKVNASGQLELDCPGSVSPLAVLKETRLCVAGLIDSTAPEMTRKLSRHLVDLQGSSVDVLTTQARRWNLSADWWMTIVDASARSLASIESRAGVIALKSASLEELSSSVDKRPGDPPRIEPSIARLGIDPLRGRFVVECKLQPHPYRPVLQDLPDLLPAEGASHDELISGGKESLTQAHAELPPLAVTTDTTIANRYVLRMVPSPHRIAPERQPQWAGKAVVVGDNPVARELESRLLQSGVDAVRWASSDDPRELANKFTKLTAGCRAPHLFLLTPCDSQAQFSLDENHWKLRRNRGTLGNFWLCQAWFEHVAKQGLANESSLLSISTLGGDFGISRSVISIEGGGLGGMLKSILIESWMQGFRSLPIKTIDTSPDQSPAEIVDALWQELAIPSYDNEIAVIDGQRHVVRAIKQTLTPTSTQGNQRSLGAITNGGTWVCTGGARGITAFVAEKLAQRYGLTLHLLGTAPVPHIDPTWRQLDEVGLRGLKVRIMTDARTAGLNPVKAWQDTEKALEIDASIHRLASLGIEAHYHCCNVADRAAVEFALNRVRQLSGPIHGILHGAGVGKDSRFDRKQADKVDQCIAAKVDGALSLMAATKHDPLECFVGFGSISGRFGANGHTDYSLANDMLCKTIDAFQSQRPACRAIGFHWHAWGDIGMATKPETKLALEMIDMQFMPAEEGFAHLVHELEGGAGEREVLITDDRYYRMFYPAETIVDARADAASEILTPLLDRVTSEPRNSTDIDETASLLSTLTVHPGKDPFLTEHLLDGRPLLPFVIAAEMLLEAGQRHLGTASVTLHNLEAITALRFFSDAEQKLRIETRAIDRGGDTRAAECRLLTDFLARDGRLVEANRVNFRAEVIANNRHPSNGRHGNTHVVIPTGATWQSVVYPEAGTKFYVGWPLQRLKKVAVVDGGIVGTISAPALIELAGAGRDVRGWRIPSAALDACLFAVGILAWQQVAPGSALPVKMRQLKLGRLPDPGEACEVHARARSSSEGTATFDFTLIGVDGAMLVDVVDYQVAWLSREPMKRESAQTNSRVGEFRNERG